MQKVKNELLTCSGKSALRTDCKRCGGNAGGPCRTKWQPPASRGGMYWQYPLGGTRPASSKTFTELWLIQKFLTSINTRHRKVSQTSVNMWKTGHIMELASWLCDSYSTSLEWQSQGRKLLTPSYWISMQ